MASGVRPGPGYGGWYTTYMYTAETADHGPNDYTVLAFVHRTPPPPESRRLHRS